MTNIGNNFEEACDYLAQLTSEQIIQDTTRQIVLSGYEWKKLIFRFENCEIMSIQDRNVLACTYRESYKVSLEDDKLYYIKFVVVDKSLEGFILVRIKTETDVIAEKHLKNIRAGLAIGDTASYKNLLDYYVEIDRFDMVAKWLTIYHSFPGKYDDVHILAYRKHIHIFTNIVEELKLRDYTVKLRADAISIHSPNGETYKSEFGNGRLLFSRQRPDEYLLPTD